MTILSHMYAKWKIKRPQITMASSTILLFYDLKNVFLSFSISKQEKRQKNYRIDSRRNCLARDVITQETFFLSKVF